MKRETIDLFNRIFKVLEPPPDLTLSQWADRYRRLSSESGSKGGKWNTEKAPWQREIMDAITDISVEKVVVMSAAQMGKGIKFGLVLASRPIRNVAHMASQAIRINPVMNQATIPVGSKCPEQYI